MLAAGMLLGIVLTGSGGEPDPGGERPGHGPKDATRADFLRTRPLGPAAVPERLEGDWIVSLCIHQGHAWIRFENPRSGALHTLSRHRKGWGGRRHKETAKWLVPPARVSGVHWDLDLHYEDQVLARQHVLLSVMVANPTVYRGQDRGFGYNLLGNNCATFARDAWHHYSGEWYWLPGNDLPEDLADYILLRHPEVRASLLARPHP
jgi:hypothetical protein